MKLLTIALLAPTISPLLAGLRPHPRVEMDPALLGQLRSLRGRNDPVWARFARWTAVKPRAGVNGVLSSMLVYVARIWM